MPLNCLRLAVLSHVGHCSPAGPSQRTHTHTHTPQTHTHTHTHTHTRSSFGRMSHSRTPATLHVVLALADLSAPFILLNSLSGVLHAAFMSHDLSVSCSFSVRLRLSAWTALAPVSLETCP